MNVGLGCINMSISNTQTGGCTQECKGDDEESQEQLLSSNMSNASRFMCKFFVMGGLLQKVTPYIILFLLFIGIFWYLSII